MVVIEFVKTGNASFCLEREGPGRAHGVEQAVLGARPGLGLPGDLEQARSAL